MRDFAQDPELRRQFEKLLYLAAKRGDADLVAERLEWGIDPDCTFARSRTPLIANVRGSCPSAAIVKPLLQHGADPSAADESGLTALDYARRKLLRLSIVRRRPPRRSPSLDENGQLILSSREQARFDKLRAEHPEWSAQHLEIYWQERLRAARRRFNDPDEIEAIIDLLEAATSDR